MNRALQILDRQQQPSRRIPKNSDGDAGEPKSHDFGDRSNCAPDGRARVLPSRSVPDATQTKRLGRSLAHPTPRHLGRDIKRCGDKNPSLRCRSGLSLVELMVAVTIMGVLMSMAAPSFHRAVDQSRADIAAANLRAIWSAQRCYWLDNRTYSADLAQLQAAGLLDSSIVAAGNYAYSIPAADTTTFTATAERIDSSRWSGQFVIDETGTVSGAIQATGELNLIPGFQ